MNDYRNYQRNHHQKHFKKGNHWHSHKPFKKTGKHVSKMQFVQQEKEKYQTTKKHHMPKHHFILKSSLKVIKTNTVTCTRTGHPAITNNSNNLLKDQQFLSLVSKIYKFYSKNNFLQRLDFQNIYIHMKYLDQFYC